MVDKVHRRVHHLDMNERSHPCDWHCRKWEKMPCIHVMRALHWLGEYWRVWELVGDYGATDRSFKLWECNEELLLWLPNMESVELDEEYGTQIPEVT